MDINQQQIEKVRRRVADCLDSLGGGSGHLASYSMAPATFRITSTEDIDAGKTRYDFSVQAFYESEFTIYEEDCDSSSPFDLNAAQTLSGYIVLDADYNMVRDKQGKVMFGPWHHVEPV